jgi:ribosomal protein L29
MKYYDSIDTFILNRWWKCTSGEIKYTRIDLNEGSKKGDWKAWCKIHDEYLEEFGASAKEKEIQELRKRLAELECDFVIEDNSFLRNEIRRLEKELLDLMTQSVQGGSNRDGLMVQLEKWMGFRLDENEVTVRKFYSIVREFEKEMDALAKAHG